MSSKYKVGIADYKVSESPEKLITLGLGSCVGIAVYDERGKVGGLSHIMLPNSKEFNKNIIVPKFADLAIPAMVDEIKKHGPRGKLVAKIAGGASMFDFASNNKKTIGERNIEAVEEELRKLKIPILAKNVGGNKGRTMLFDLENLEVSIRMVNGQYTIL